jgi:CRP-like cAMP-binding protein
MPTLPLNLLRQYEASLNRFAKGEHVFHEGRQAFFYFQVEDGLVKMYNEGAKNDFVQGVFRAGESFGEPPLLDDFPYPASACALTDTKIWVLKKAAFLDLLRQNPDAHLGFTIALARRLRYKALVMRDSTLASPEEALLTLIDYFKQQVPFEKRASGWYEVPFTRQLLADLMGLRVETVIKKVIQLAERGQLELREHKIYRKYNP